MKLAGDIDGDGRLDLILGGLPQTQLSWWRWPDLPLTTIATARVEFTTDGVLVDVDGDGDLDIVTADRPDGPISSGSRIRARSVIRPTARDGNTMRSAQRRLGQRHQGGRFDGDGLADIVVRTPSELMIFFQGTAGSWTRVALPSFRLGEEGMTLGDIDRDGAVDLVLSGQWAQNPGAATARNPARWQSHEIGAFSHAFKALVVDLDRDGNADILTSSSEHTADVAWFQVVDGPAGRWIRYIIQPAVAGAHTLQAADMDGDGDVDVVVGQMHRAEERALSVHLNVDGRGMRWARQVIDTVGLHNGVVADIDSDGDFDIYGAIWAGTRPA